jgi:hypothetical protein
LAKIIDKIARRDSEPLATAKQVAALPETDGRDDLAEPGRAPARLERGPPARRPVFYVTERRERTLAKIENLLVKLNSSTS